MNPRSLIWLGVIIGSTVGGFVPELWGANFLSYSSIIFSTIGGIAGVWGGFKLSQMM